MNTSNIVGLLIAVLGGAAVGLERQWSGHADGPGARFAGIRTFTMLGAVGGLSGWLWTAGITAPAAILLFGAVARRIVGPGHGYLVTGLLGGLVSSTNVTFTFARTSRADVAADRALAFGAVAANALLYPRVLVATAILNAAVVPPLVPFLVAPALIATLLAFVGARRSPPAGAPDVAVRNPLQLAAALQMAVLFQGVLMAVHLASDMWGQAGVFTSAAVLGLTDVDALTVSMARGVAATASPVIAATAIAVGVLANTAMKLGLAVVFGAPRFRAIAGSALALMLVAIGGALLILSR
jgi:uncharacterized membrane protein (DUF4010 family)